ncbi:hypothetical protein [Geobacter anodireducens]
MENLVMLRLDEKLYEHYLQRAISEQKSVGALVREDIRKLAGQREGQA